MSRPAPDWSRFEKRIYIARPPEVVYRAWALPQQLTQWFLEEAYYLTGDKENQRHPDELIQKGDRHNWKWHNWDIMESGVVLEANEKDRLCFTFGKGGQVHLLFEKRDEGTELTLIQENIPQDEEGKMNYYVGCATGWTFWLTNLKAWLEHGITLHARGLSQSEVIDRVNA